MSNDQSENGYKKRADLLKVLRDRQAKQKLWFPTRKYRDAVVGLVLTLL